MSRNPKPAHLAVVDGAQVKMTEGVGIVVLPQETGQIWIGVRTESGCLDFTGNAYGPEAARLLAADIMGRADEVQRDGPSRPQLRAESEKRTATITGIMDGTGW